MDIVAVVASLVVGAAMLLAGGSKLAAGATWPPQARALGAPSWSIPVVPWLELAVGAALITQVARRPAALAALGLLVAFTALIARRLAEGRRPACACFGAWSASPLGWKHLARNGVLLAAAALAIA